MIFDSPYLTKIKLGLKNSTQYYTNLSPQVKRRWKGGALMITGYMLGKATFRGLHEPTGNTNEIFSILFAGMGSVIVGAPFIFTGLTMTYYSFRLK